MTINETRQLGIEFERRVQTMIPQKEILEKLDTETIYSYLNQAQDEYVNLVYTSSDKILSGTPQSSRFESILLPLFTSATILKSGDSDTWVFGDGFPITFYINNQCVTFVLPNNISMYINSTSKTNGSYRFRHSSSNKPTVLQNVLVSPQQFYNLVDTADNSLRILRHPVITLSTSGSTQTVSLLHDIYTDIQQITIYYYRRPNRFSILTNTCCELPSSAFNDIVTSAVELYVQYVAGAEAKRRQLLEQARNQAEQQLLNRPNTNNDSDERSRYNSSI